MKQCIYFQNTDLWKTVNTNLFSISVSIVKCRVTKATGKLLLSRKEE